MLWHTCTVNNGKSPSNYSICCQERVFECDEEEEEDVSCERFCMNNNVISEILVGEIRALPWRAAA